MDGTIISILERGFGFIEPAGGGKPDLFFHASAVVDLPFGEQLLKQRVSFEVEDTPKGLQAVNVRPASR